jgi:hypothetical protein
LAASRISARLRSPAENMPLGESLETVCREIARIVIES